MKNLNIKTDPKSIAIYGRQISDSTYLRNCQAGIRYEVPIPTDAHCCIVSGSANYVVMFADIALPAAGALMATNEVCLNPEVISDWGAKTSFYIASADNGYISVEFYKIVG